MKISLTGIWQLSGSDSEGNQINIPAPIPGYAETALEKEGLLPELFYRDNNESCHWVEDHEWIYERIFDAPDASFKKAYIEFDSIDT